LPNSSWKSYTVVATTAVQGVTFAGYATLSATDHSSTGEYKAQVHVDGALRERFTLEFVEKAS
jgi:hypothetical protein